ncbi:MAG: thiamine phosphate synthase [Deltaproteobacteria bacterium]|nr:thiamine phosphate synthase [Deltaproteobacteria bacterium]
MNARLPFRFLLVTDRKIGGGNWIDKIAIAVESGVPAVQLREKDLSSEELLRTASQLAEKLKSHPVHLFVNSDVEIAKALGWNLHLSESKISHISSARKILGGKMWIGASTHSLDQARSAQAQGADYLLFGPVFETPSKKQFGSPQGLAKLEEVAHQVSIPVFAVGGITPERALECRKNGAYGVAVISAILGASDIAAAVSAFQREVI